MIKEKETYVINGQENTLVAKTFLNPGNGMIENTFKNNLNAMLAHNGISVTIADDIFALNSGFLKSAQTPCVVISNSEAPNSFKKLVVAFLAVDGNMMVYPRWFDSSECDRLREKSMKVIKKRDKSFNKAEKNADINMSRSMGNLVSAHLKNSKVNKLVKKIDARKGIERQYHDSVAYAFSMAVNAIG